MHTFISIKNTPVYIINLQKHIAKLETIQNELKNTNFKNINIFTGIEHDNPVVGCALSHLLLLSDIINKHDFFIVIEDDCMIFNDINYIQIPSNTDALYLGLSSYGWYNSLGDTTKTLNKDYIKYIDTPIQNICKIENMLSTHAILYKSKDFINHTIRICKYFIDIKDHFDKGMAESMKYYNIMALKNPLFYQTSSLKATKIYR